MPSVHVLSQKELLEPDRLGAQVVVVLDILFATTTIAYAFSEGVSSIWPAVSHAEAVSIAARVGPCVIAGEHLAEPLPGFAAATPLMLSREPLSGSRLVYCTTNGTVALRHCADAAHVYAGALVNGAALVRHVVCEHPDSPVLIVCSGSVGRFNLEDFYGAGHLVAHFAHYPGYEFDDAARAALMLRQANDPLAALSTSRVGKMMCARSLAYELEHAARTDVLDVVPRLEGECLQPAIARAAE
jgi:2-phosphosulfolactate phosphatase